MSSSEHGYAQIDKEATAIVYAIRYFHQFLYSREFIIRTDHKPLVGIFGPKKGIPVMATNRLQRYAIFYQGIIMKYSSLRAWITVMRMHCPDFRWSFHIMPIIQS